MHCFPFKLYSYFTFVCGFVICRPIKTYFKFSYTYVRENFYAFAFSLAAIIEILS